MKKIIHKSLFEHSKESRIRAFLLGVIDVMMISFFIVTSLLVRFDLSFHSVEPVFWDSMITYLPIGIISTVIIFILFKLYSSMWTYASIEEALHIVFASLTAMIVQIITIFFVLDLPSNTHPLLHVFRIKNYFQPHPASAE